MVLKYIFHLIHYCLRQSKECQTYSWKSSHNQNCVPHPSVAALDGAKPQKWGDERIELEVDTALSKWMAEWRSCFVRWTIISLDLANQPPVRVVSHWYVISFFILLIP